MAQTGAGLVALEHYGQTRGGFWNRGRLAPTDAVSLYGAQLSVEPSTVSVFAVRLEGSLPEAALSGLPVHAHAVVPAAATVAVAPAGARVRSIDVMHGRVSRSSGGPGLASIPAEHRFAPQFGKLAADQITVPFLLFFTRDYARFHHELLWESQSDIDSVGNDSYEHDVKLFDESLPPPAGPGRPLCGAGRFWAESTSETWETTFPPETKPYRDVSTLDPCSWEDFTIGMFWPKHLQPNVTYTILMTTDRGDANASPVQLIGERIGKDGPPNCWESPWCGLTHVAAVFFIAKGEGVQVPTCRTWSRTPSEPSQPCGP